MVDLIDSEAFKGREKLSFSDVKKLVIPSAHDVTSLIPRWNGKIVAAMVISLSNDNRKVASCSPILRGPIFKDDFKSFSFETYLLSSA